MDKYSDVKLVVFDFDGVFTNNKVFVFQDGKEAVVCNRSDGFGLEMLRKAGLCVLVISTEKNPVVSVRCEKLRIPCIYGVDDKLSVLKNEAKKLKVDLNQVAYMGNDINDLKCMEVVGLPACVADAYPEVKKISKFMSSKNGGDGAVREFCEFITKTRMK